MASPDHVGRVLNPIVLHQKKMELELNCPICLKLPDQPLLLPCDHMLCKHCISSSTDDGLICPLCGFSFGHKDLRSATHIGRLLSIFNNMNSAIAALLQDSNVTSSRTTVSCNNHTEKTHTHDAGNEAFIDQMELSPPFDNVRDSNSDNLDQEEYSKTKRRPANISPKFGLNYVKENAKINDPKESKRAKLENDSIERPSKVDVDGNIIQTCAFCHSFRTTQASGEMLHYLNGKPIPEDQSSQPNALHVHRSCIEWAPQVYFSGETVMNLETELSRSSKIKCSSCGLKGAALGCYVKSCRKSFHVPCAYEIQECRWDCENYLLLCPVHASRKLPCDNSRSNKSKNSSVDPSISSEYETTETEEENEVSVSSFSLSIDWVICGSGLSKEDKLLLDRFSKLNGLVVTCQWEQNVTHVIAATNGSGACIRTMKFLMAILNGRWILNMGWIIACLEAGHLVSEENYEITHDVHGCFDGPKNGRIQAMQRAPKLFNALTFHFIGFFEPSYKSTMESLAIAAGGKVLNKLELLNLNISSPDSETERPFIVYCVDSPNPDKVVERLEDAEELAAKVGALVVRHTLFLNAIAAYDLHLLSS